MLTALDPSLQPSHREYVPPSTKTLLKFPICNGEVHSINEILSMFPQCSISNYETEDQSKPSTPNNSSKDHESHDNVAYEHTIDNIPCSRAKSKTLKSNKQNSSDSAVEKKSNYNVKGKHLGIKFCYRCGDASHKVSECTFEKNIVRANNIMTRNDKWIKKEKSLNCLPDECYNIFS
ncbi:hypothetical protein Lser_V15G20906 [Lactuca serriola]